MTEEEWQGCQDPAEMLFRAEAGSPRKIRLLASAVCRRVWGAMEDDRGHKAVQAAERFADGKIDEDELEEAFGDAAEEMGEHTRRHTAAHSEAMAAASCAAQEPLDGPDLLECLERAAQAAGAEEPTAQAALFRDVYGGLRPVALMPAQLTPAVISLAHAAYDKRRTPSGELSPQRLAVLADALEEAGTPGELVAHLRSAGPHVRGCWVVDLTLGKS
jgi:hypothetical protein